MSDTIIFGRSEGRLLGHLAAALATHLVRMEGAKGPARKGDTFFHSFQTAFVDADGALKSIGVLVPRETATKEPTHSFALDADDIPDFLAAHPDDEKAAKLREAFVSVACGCAGLCDERVWFDAAPPWTDAMRYLAMAGYAEHGADRFRWTDKIGPAMRAAGHWNENDQALSTLQHAEHAADAELAWQTLPDTLRQSIRSSSIGFMELVKVLALSWRHGRWHDFKLDDHCHLSGQWELAEWLLERARHP